MVTHSHWTGFACAFLGFFIPLLVRFDDSKPFFSFPCVIVSHTFVGVAPKTHSNILEFSLMINVILSLLHALAIPTKSTLSFVVRSRTISSFVYIILYSNYVNRFSVGPVIHRRLTCGARG